MVILSGERHVNYPYCGKHFTIYTCINPSQCIPESYTICRLYLKKLRGKKAHTNSANLANSLHFIPHPEATSILWHWWRDASNWPAIKRFFRKRKGKT